MQRLTKWDILRDFGVSGLCRVLSSRLIFVFHCFSSAAVCMSKSQWVWESLTNQRKHTSQITVMNKTNSHARLQTWIHALEKCIWRPSGSLSFKEIVEQWTHLSPLRRNHFLFYPSKRFVVSAESKWAKKTQKLVWKWNLSSLKMTTWSPYPDQVQVILKMQQECIKFSSCVEGLFPVTVASSKLAPTLYRVSRLRIQLQSTPSTLPC